jgi:membrane fusion protein (multidrug efflux system)
MLLTLSAFVSTSCSKDGEAKDKNGEKEEVLVPVEIAEVHQDNISAFLTGTATLEAEDEAEVVAKATGIVEKILVEEGMVVQKGQVLAKLEDEMLSVDMDGSQADLDKLENDFQRNKELFEKNLISKEEFQSVRFQYESQQAAFEKAKLNFEYASIRAPISGVIAARHIKTGNMVAINEAVFKIVDFQHLIANLFVPEVEIHKIKLGQEAELHFDANSGIAVRGYVERISPVVDPNSGTVKVTVAAKGADSRVKPGMFARVRIVYDTHQNTLLIPKQAVVEEDGAEIVYTIADSLAVKQIVKTGYFSESTIEIVVGVAHGDRVVVVGQNGLKDSSKVEIVQ